MSHWAVLVQQRAYAARMGVAMFGLALVTLLADAVVTISGAGRLPTIPIAVMFALFGTQCFMAYQLLGQIARLQAALDMIALARETKGPPEP